MNTSFKLSKRLSFGEEIANSVTHAVGALIMLILLPISSTYSYEAHGFLSSIGVSIFVISLFLMFLSSTIYHSMAYGSTHKYVLRIIDHSMIYVAIAGSYTPVVLTLMNNWFGYLIIAIQWANSKRFQTEKFAKLTFSSFLYSYNILYTDTITPFAVATRLIGAYHML